MKYLITLSALILTSLSMSAQTASISRDTTVYGNAESNFPGGQNAYNKFIQTNTHLPALAKEKSIDGCVYVRFSIEKDGTLSNINIYSGVDIIINDEAIRVIIKSGRWTPSKVNGNSVRTNCIVPVRFHIIDDHSCIIYGYVADTSYLSKMIAFESSGIPIKEISSYPYQKISFVGQVYGTKALSDTTFILTCGQHGYTSKYVNVVLMGKGAQVDNPKKNISGYLIKGTGTVLKSNGEFIIAIEDKKQYSLIPEPRRTE